jgi:hypothetical protein
MFSFRTAIVGVTLLAACGGWEPSGGLTGVVPVRLEWMGSWSEPDQAAIVAYVQGLSAAGYFAGLAPRHIDPRFVVTDADDTLVRVVLRAPGAEPGDATARLAYHDADRSRRRFTITVNPEATHTWIEAAYVLAHELVETAADPWCADPDAEVADDCVFEGYALASIRGSDARVPRYRSALTQGLCKCWPCDGRIPVPDPGGPAHER